MQDTSDRRELPLKGVKVLDFGRYIAGPYCAALLAEFGADVIRIEKLAGSEDRHVSPVSSQGDGSLFLQMNRNKRSLALDPKSEGGKRIIRRLVEASHVVVANLPAPTLRRMGLAYDQLCEINPAIILTTASTFGDTGEWSERLGFDTIAQAMSGVVYLSGEEDGAPSRSQASWVDFGTALHCAYGTVLAIMEQRQTGRGQQVSGNLLSTAMAMMNPQHLEQDLIEANRPPLGNFAAGTAPVGTFKAKDGWVSVHVVGQSIFERLVSVIGREDWLEDPRFATDPLRGDNREPILETMSEWCADRTRDEILDLFAENRIPAGPVLSLQEAIEHQQAQALGLHQDVEYPGLAKPAKIARAPVWLSGHDTKIGPPPLLGADTDAILAQLEFRVEEREQMKREGAI